MTKSTLQIFSNIIPILCLSDFCIVARADEPVNLASTQPVFELRPFIKNLSGPSVDELLSSADTDIPADELLAFLKQPRPEIPELPPAVVADVLDNERRANDLVSMAKQIPTDAELRGKLINEAIRLEERALAVRLKYQGADSIAFKRWATSAHTTSREWHEVLDCRYRIATARRLLNLSDSSIAKIKTVQSEIAALDGLVNSRNYPAAQRIVEQQLALHFLLFGDDELDLARWLGWLAGILEYSGDLAAAETLFCRSLAIINRQSPGETPDTVSSLNNLGELCKTRGNQRGAVKFLTKSLYCSALISPHDSQKIATGLMNLALVYQVDGNINDAEAMLREALAMGTRVAAGENEFKSVCMMNLAGAVKRQGDLVEAESLAKEALRVRTQLTPGDHLSTGECLGMLGSVLHAKADLRGAESLYRTALDMERRLFATDHPKLADCLNNLAVLYSDTGELDIAEPLARDALAMRRRLFKGDHHELAISLMNLAAILDDRGELTEAELHHKAALEMQERMFVGDHYDIERCLHNFAVLKMQTGDFTGAESMLVKALAMDRRLFSGDHLDIAAATGLLASIREAQLDFKGAVSMRREALEMMQRLLTAEHPIVAMQQSKLADALYALGNKLESEQLYRLALTTLQSSYGTDHPEIVYALYRTARMSRAEGNLRTTEDRYRHAFEMAERLRARIVGSELSRADFAGKLGLSEIGIDYARTLVRLERFSDSLAILERSRGRAFLDLLARSTHDLVEVARQNGDAKRTEKIVAALTREESARIDLTIAEARVASLRNERKRLVSRSDLVSNEREAELAKADARISEQQIRVKNLRGQLSEASATVLIELQSFFPTARPMPAAAIRKGLSPDEAIVCYAWSDEFVLLIVAPPTGQGDVKGFVLTDDKETTSRLNALAGRVRGELSHRPGIDQVSLANDARRLLDQLVPPEVLGDLKSVKRLVIIPDGPLNGIPFEALIAFDVTMKYKAFHEVAIVYSSSATAYLNGSSNHEMSQPKVDGQVEEAQGKSTSAMTALVVGDPSFDSDVAPKPDYPKQGIVILVVTADSRAAKAGLRRGDVLVRYAGRNLIDMNSLTAARNEIDTAIAEGGFQANGQVKVAYWRSGATTEIEIPPDMPGVQLDPKGSPAETLQYLAMLSRGEPEKIGQIIADTQLSLFDRRLERLQGTRREAEVIAQIVQSADGKAILLLGKDATVGKIAAAAPGLRILHLATHGLMGSTDRPYDASLAFTQPVSPTLNDIGFLRLEDLLRTWQGKLKDCDLVVLSACETQSGVKRGDSVLALPWGFFFAGAPTVIASVWKVDDTATALLMIRFYENLLGKFKDVRHGVNPGTRMPKGIALSEAKQWLQRLTVEEVTRLCKVYELSVVESARGEPVPPANNVPNARPFEHPYYWASFILMGRPN